MENTVLESQLSSATNLSDTPLAELAERLRLLAISPFEQPDIALASLLCRQGIAATVDLGRDVQVWPALLDKLAGEQGPGLGVRIPEAVDASALQLPDNIQFLIASVDTHSTLTSPQLPWIAQVHSLEEALQAQQAGAIGLIAKGQESGGLTGDESSFVLLQRLVEKVSLPVWCQGGMGLNTAAGAFAGGAYGIVLDAVLAGFAESSLPAELKSQVLAMDGSEVHCVADYQVYARSQKEVSALEGLDATAITQALAAGDLLPIGQDAALAGLVMSDCANLEALIQSLRMRVTGQLHQARNLSVLDEDNAWARSHGTRYPVAQGPMTRVSDTAEFAAAVANAGGLPFQALSLMREAACRDLLETTKAQVGDKPWGVGVLGFAAPEVLEPQLELIKQIKPSVLLLAGGRPSQARPFIELGIPSYLHVPSPGLLDIFLKDGATHFVFEGRECGGHVGPRYSFVLWEQAIARLSQVEHPEQLHILFAGGIHDARSSAMVAAMAAPLAARGAKIAVLMGTAYIATEEAVSCGAVLKGFQNKALADEQATALVETAPGHAIRCLPSGFMDLFEREKQRLQQEAVDSKQAWAELEKLTVGRLRIATKGRDYVDGQLTVVDAATQEAEGMYMIGQIIAMKQQVTTVAELHAEVTRGASEYLEALTLPSLLGAAQSEAVAIVGMACIYPGSPDLESYWTNILEGRDLVTEVPAERWNVDQYYQGAGAAADKSVSKWGGFISDTPFDPLSYGIPPASLAAIEPVQLLSLEVARQALQDAGYAQRWFDRDRTSVIFGAEAGMDLGNQYTFRNLYQQYCGDMPEALAQALPSLTEDSFPGMLVNVISGRIANRLGLGGVNYSVTSACASSLTAIELGVKELRAGSSEMVLAGGADFHNGIADFLMFSSVGALSAKGRCRSFDNEADGIALGEGVAVVVLKRLSDAERDGDRIYALIEGVAGSSDGRGLGLTAPRKEGQKRALERAYWQAGVLPADIGLVEAHGTGTVVGDRTELQTLTEVFTAGGAVPGQAGLGSVKSQIGHTKCAAGLAGLIKVAKALHHQVLPPTGQITTPNAAYRRDSSPFQLNRQPAPWRPVGERAYGAVSAFGFGGANFHALLSSYPAHQVATGAQVLPAELFVIRGETRVAADKILQQLQSFIRASNAPYALRDLARTAWEAGSGPVQVAFAAADVESLQQRIDDALANKVHAAVHVRQEGEPGKVAVLFSGQGSQYPGMLRELFVYFPALQALFDQHPDLLSAIYPTTAYDEESRKAQQQRLTDTRITQPALGLVEWAGFEWLKALGLTPDMAAGHSYGELAALATAGAFDADKLITLSRARAEAMVGSIGEGDSGAMAAVRLDVATLEPLLAAFPNIVLANQNSPVQTVISGPTADIEAACVKLSEQNIGYRRLATDCAFHSPLMQAAEQRYADALGGANFAALNWPVYSNITAQPHDNDAAAIRSSLARHIVSPVRFVSEIEAMYADGARVFVEVGPRKVLTGLVGRILEDQPHHRIALDPEAAGLAGLFEQVAQLAVLLPDFDADALFAGRADCMDLSVPQTLPATTWMVNGGRAWPLQGKLPAHAPQLVTTPVLGPSAVAQNPVLPGRSARAEVSAGDQAMVSYLSNMREMVNAQRDVLLGYFGADNNVAATQRSAIAPVRTVQAAPVSLPQATALAQSIDSKAILLDIVSERTGYPAEMLDPDLDLEADLSIDSIKRLEIIGELSERLGLREVIDGDADVLLEQLAAQKTLRAMLDWLGGQLPAEAAPVATTVSSAEHTQGVATPDSEAVLLAIVSERTGYPQEMLDADLDLEADLSIDSIKRLEIIGELSERLDLRSVIEGDADSLLEQLAAQKTLRAMLNWLREQIPSAVSAEAETPAAEAAIAQTVPAVADLLIDIVSQSTGYPAAALDLDLDLEADLSIDSIKRLEVVGQLGSRLGMDNEVDKDAMLEELSGLKTLRAMIAWLEQRHPADAVPVVDADIQADDSAEIPLERYVLRCQDAPQVVPASLVMENKQFLISDDHLGLAPLVKSLLEARGARARIVDFKTSTTLPADLDQFDGLLHLWSLNPASRLRDIKRFFAVVRASSQRAEHLLVASALGGDFNVCADAGSYGGGFAGLVKSVAREFPALRAHWVDFDLSESLGDIAQHIETELLAKDALPEVAYQGGHRYVREVVPLELTADSVKDLPLTADSVVLITGGARGITAKIAIELAQRYQCHLEIVGRSPQPQPDTRTEFEGIDDARQLRQALFALNPGLKPAEIERQVRQFFANRDACQTLAQIEAVGARFNYSQMDVRDSRSFLKFIDQVYERCGRIDGVIHGAGVVEDKLVIDKTDDSFSRVFDTKVSGALALQRRIRDDVKFVVFFSSVASAFGNKGQVDYASANDVLDKLAYSWQQRIDGRVLSVNWGPWADTGMVSDSLKREYHRKGIGLIPQQAGVQALLRELSSREGDSQVVLMCGKPGSFADHPAGQAAGVGA